MYWHPNPGSPFPSLAPGHPRLFILLLGLVLSLAACRTTSAPYSAAEARELNGLKSKSLRLMEQAEYPFPEHRKAVTKLRAELTDARTVAAARRGNEISVGQWDLMLAPDGHLLGGFLARWEQDGALSPSFIVESIAQVKAAFESMAQHESNKTGGPR